MQKSMTSGNSLKLLLTFMVPLIIGNIFQQMYSISDIIIVGRTIGVNALASVGAAAPIFMLLVMMTMGMSNGLTVITGQFFGANDFNNMRRSVAMSMMLSVPEVLYEDTRSYILIVAEGLWAMMAYNFFSAVLRALGDSKTPVAFLIFATIINVGLALLFILKFGMGVPGSAYALVMAQGISAFLCVIYMWKHFPILRLQKSDWKWDNAFAIQHLKMGLPMAGQFSILGVGILLIQSITNSFGPNTIAGFTAAISAANGFLWYRHGGLQRSKLRSPPVPAHPGRSEKMLDDCHGVCRLFRHPDFLFQRKYHRRLYRRRKPESHRGRVTISELFCAVLLFPEPDVYLPQRGAGHGRGHGAPGFIPYRTEHADRRGQVPGHRLGIPGRVLCQPGGLGGRVHLPLFCVPVFYQPV